jgi:hypothetical protein
MLVWFCQSHRFCRWHIIIYLFIYITLVLSNNNVYVPYTTDSTIKAIQSTSPALQESLFTVNSILTQSVLQTHRPDAARNQYLTHRCTYALVRNSPVLMKTSDSPSLCRWTLARCYTHILPRSSPQDSLSAECLLYRRQRIPMLTSERSLYRLANIPSPSTARSLRLREETPRWADCP